MDSPAIYDISLATSVDADTVYWIGLSGATTNAEWFYDSSESGTGTEAESFVSPVGEFPNADGPYQMQVSTQVMTGTPEPAGTLLIVAGTGVLVLFRRRTA